MDRHGGPASGARAYSAIIMVSCSVSQTAPHMVADMQGLQPERSSATVTRAAGVVAHRVRELQLKRWTRRRDADGEHAKKDGGKSRAGKH